MQGCEIEGCGRVARKRGLCYTHYKRDKAGRPGGVIETHMAPRPGDACDHEGCDRPLLAKGFCSLHYEYRRASRGPSCVIADCERKVSARGYCSGHYSRLLRGADLEAPFNKYVVKTGVCKAPLCQEPDDHRNYCAKHYSLVMKYHLSDNQALALFSVTSCGICSTEDSRLVIDHDHACCPEKSKSCGACIRGMVCASCNTGLGYFRDSPSILKAAIEYLRPSTQIL